METYYTITFTLLLLLQDKFEGFILSLICLSSTLLRVYGYQWVDSYGVGFQESGILVEVFVLLATTTTHTIHKNYWLILLVSLGVCLNMYLFFSTNITYVLWLYERTVLINTLMFEILVFLCIRESWIYPKLLDWLSSIAPDQLKPKGI